MSERTLDADLKTSAQSANFNHAVFVELAFPSGTVRVHNSVGTKSFGGNDYIGVGAYGSISPIQETGELVDSPIQLTLSSITPAIITAVQTDDVFGRDADIYLGALDADGQLVGTPTNWISGYMEFASLIVGKENAVSVQIQTRAARLLLRNNRRFTNEDHQNEFPGDLFFEFLPYLIDADANWAGDKVRIGFTSNDGLAPVDYAPGRGGRRGGRR